MDREHAAQRLRFEPVFVARLMFYSHKQHVRSTEENSLFVKVTSVGDGFESMSFRSCRHIVYQIRLPPLMLPIQSYSSEQRKCSL